MWCTEDKGTSFLCCTSQEWLCQWEQLERVEVILQNVRSVFLKTLKDMKYRKHWETVLDWRSLKRHDNQCNAYSWIEHGPVRKETLLGELVKFERALWIRSVLLYQYWFPDLENWVQGREKSVLFVGNYTLKYLVVTGHHVCSLQSKILKIMITGLHTHTDYINSLYYKCEII